MSNITPVQRLKSVLKSDSVQEQFQNALKEGSDLFVASLIDIYASDNYLQKCQPQAVIMEALKAATLKLPINKNLGFAYIVPYGSEPQFQLGYKGYIQLAQRTGKYRIINADVVYEGELKRHEKVTGELDLSGEAKSDKVIGYFAHIETINGFKKTIYWTKEKMTAHAKKYSKSFNNKSSAWQSNFDEMALKTMLRSLLSKYGIMSVEMMGAMSHDLRDETTEEKVVDEIMSNANSEFIDVEITERKIDMETGEIKQDKSTPEGPDF